MVMASNLLAMAFAPNSVLVTSSNARSYVRSVLATSSDALVTSSLNSVSNHLRRYDWIPKAIVMLH